MKQEDGEMSSIDLEIVMVNGEVKRMQITRAWAGILMQNKFPYLPSIVKGQGWNWNSVMEARIVNYSPEDGICIHNLLDL